MKQSSHSAEYWTWNSFYILQTFDNSKQKENRRVPNKCRADLIIKMTNLCHDTKYVQKNNNNKKPKILFKHKCIHLMRQNTFQVLISQQIMKKICDICPPSVSKQKQRWVDMYTLENKRGKSSLIIRWPTDLGIIGLASWLSLQLEVKTITLV